MKFIRPGAVQDLGSSLTRASTATYFNSAGLLVTAAINEPRITYNPATLEHEGLLYEPAATNLFLNSSDFSNVFWTKAAALVPSYSADISPDGTTSAAQFKESAVSSTFECYRIAALTIGDTRTLSFYLKDSGSTYVLVSICTGSFVNGVYAFFDLVSGTVALVNNVGGSVGGTATIHPGPNGWYRCEVTLLSAPTTNNYYAAASPRSTLSLAAYLGNVNNGFYIWGAQLETGAAATSYIPTTTNTVTRAADVATAGASGILYSTVLESYNMLQGNITQTITTSATAYTLSFKGTGTVTLTGTSTAGPTVGSSLTTRVTRTFVPTAGSLTLTVSGTVSELMLEVGSSYTTYTTARLWDSAVSYVVGERVLLTNTHKIYENIIAGINTTSPELAPTRWLEIGATNKWALFDSTVGTSTMATGSMVYILKPGRINSIALLELDAELVEISLVDDVTGELVYSASMDLTTNSTVGDWYSYFYEPIYTQDTVVATNLVDTTLLNLPAYTGGILTVRVSRPNAECSCGVVVVGLSADIGSTQTQPTIGIIDYSRKETDIFGNPTIIKRRYSKRMSTKLMMKSTEVDQVARVLAQYRSTPVVWVGADNTYTSLIIYGFYKDFDISIDNVLYSSCTLQVEGLT